MFPLASIGKREVVQSLPVAMANQILATNPVRYDKVGMERKSDTKILLYSYRTWTPYNECL